MEKMQALSLYLNSIDIIVTIIHSELANITGFCTVSEISLPARLLTVLVTILAISFGLRKLD